MQCYTPLLLKGSIVYRFLLPPGIPPDHMSPFRRPLLSTAQAQQRAGVAGRLA